jgi:hypothetical protein
VNDDPHRLSRGQEAMLVLEALAPLLVGIAALAFLILAFAGANGSSL